MALAATLYLEETDERRNAPRRVVKQETTMRHAGQALSVTLHDLSTTGALIETANLLSIGSTITIGLAGVGRFAATVISASGQRFGCRFARPLAPQAVALAFAGDPVVVGSFENSDSWRSAEPPAVEKYPGPFRLALPIGGAVLGWAALIQAARAMLS